LTTAVTLLKEKRKTRDIIVILGGKGASINIVGRTQRVDLLEMGGEKEVDLVVCKMGMGESKCFIVTERHLGGLL